MKIGDREIGGSFHPPYIVAEISGNHCGSLAMAKRLIKEAKRAGADAVKTQCYDADTITIDCRKPDFIVQSGLWYGRSLYELYQKASTPLAWHKELYKTAADMGIPIFSSVFDRSSVDLLETLNAPAYKIASFEIVDLPLIEYAASTKKPIIISTGLASNAEILDADDAADEQAAFLHCTSEYPGTVESANLGRMAAIDKLLNHSNPVGLSDHTQGYTVAVAATALKAAIIEKHLKIKDASMKSEDDAFSMDTVDFQMMADRVRLIHAACSGSENHGADSSKQFRRSIYAIAPIKKGEAFTEANIRSIRPGYGLPPKHLPVLLDGGIAKRDYWKGEPIK